jgi:ferredoxin-like protein FixX
MGGNAHVSKRVTDLYSFKTKTGRVVFDHAYFAAHSAQRVVDACPQKILGLNDKDLPVLNIPEEEAARGKCTECLACEVATWNDGCGAYVDLPIESLVH